jgi:hypothetical protein
MPIFYWATETFNNSSHDKQKELAEDFPDYHHKDGTFEIPEFQLVHRTIAGTSSSGKVKTEAYAVQIECQHGKSFKRVMELTFKSPTSKRLSRTPSNRNKSNISSTYAKKIQAAFSPARTTASAPSTPRHPAWNRPPVDIEYKNNNSNEEFPPLSTTKPSTSEDTGSTASSTRLTFNEDSIQKAIADSKSEWERETKQLQVEMRQSQQDFKQSIGVLINNALATQVKKIVDEMVTAFGTNANLSKHFIVQSELDDVVSRISTEMATQLQAIQGDPPRKPPAKGQQLTPPSPSRNYYSSLRTQDMNDDYGEVDQARSNIFEKQYDTPPRSKPPSV